jgi:hypothetical protein
MLGFVREQVLLQADLGRHGWKALMQRLFSKRCFTFENTSAAVREPTLGMLK